jgi:hypothetical protein
MENDLPATQNLAGIFSALAIVLVLCVIPVSADISIPTLTNVFFERNGTPVNESVSFTMNCYGTACRPSEDCWNKRVQDATPQNESVVFSFSATCPSYGCKIYEPYYLNYRHITRCDIEGDHNGAKFLLRNFSSTPDPNCRMVPDLGMYELEKVNRSDMILDPNGHPVMRTCELRAPLPSPENPVNTSRSGSPATTDLFHEFLSFLNRLFGGAR